MKAGLVGNSVVYQCLAACVVGADNNTFSYSVMLFEIVSVVLRYSFVGAA